MISGTKSNWQLARSGILQRSRPVPILFNFLMAWTNWEDHLIWVVIRRNLNRLQTWARRNLVKFNKGKTKVLYLWQNNLMQQHRLGSDCLENSFAEKDEYPSRKQEFSCSKDQLPTGMYMQKRRQQVGRSDYFPLFRTCEKIPGVLWPIWGNLVQERYWLNWRKSSREPPRSLGSTWQMRKGWEQGLFTLKERRLKKRLREGHTAVYKHLEAILKLDLTSTQW